MAAVVLPIAVELTVGIAVVMAVAVIRRSYCGAGYLGGWSLSVYGTMHGTMVRDQDVPSGGGSPTVYGTVYGTLGRAKLGVSLLGKADPPCTVLWVGLPCTAP